MEDRLKSQQLAQRLKNQIESEKKVRGELIQMLQMLEDEKI